MKTLERTLWCIGLSIYGAAYLWGCAAFGPAANTACPIIDLADTACQYVTVRSPDGGISQISKDEFVPIGETVRGCPK
jgi:hypothetical protein